MKGILSCHSPASLLNTVFYLNGKNFHLRSYQEHATLRFSQIRRFTNPDCYVYYEYGSKSHPGGIADPTAGKLFSFQPQILAGAMLIYSTFTFLKSRHLPSKVTLIFT